METEKYTVIEMIYVVDTIIITNTQETLLQDFFFLKKILKKCLYCTKYIMMEV